MAGLEAVPCVISHLTEQEQVRTMLMENMQRSDLTVYEQAQGFQMMMDLGDTAEAIADKTGFSASTVRRRLKLLELDKEKFAAASERGATLMDFAALDGIDDIKTRNKVLEHVGTANFNYELKKTIDKQEDDKRRKRWLELLETFATKTDDTKELRYVKSLYGAPDDFTIPEDSREIKYFYKIESWGLTLYREKTEEAPSPEEEARRIAEERRKQLDKRIVEIGQKDEDNGDCEIKSGLEKGDYIAYPDKSIEEGMTATTNEADVSVPPNDLGTDDNSDGDTEGGDEDIAFDGSGEDGMAIDEDMLASMTDEEIEEYFNKLYGEEENADGENADAADADAAFAE